MFESENISVWIRVLYGAIVVLILGAVAGGIYFYFFILKDQGGPSGLQVQIDNSQVQQERVDLLHTLSASSASSSTVSTTTTKDSAQLLEEIQSHNASQTKTSTGAEPASPETTQADRAKLLESLQHN